jgi:hypothetical protein
VAKVEMKQRQVKEVETRREFNSAMSLMLGGQHRAWKSPKEGILMRPHPIAYPLCNEDYSFAIKVMTCAKCGSDFPFKDIILSPCRHAFHPWCAIMHFSESNYCPYEACKAMATPEWCKSFGIREFNSAMIELEVKRGCKEARMQILKDWREVALSIYPDVEQTEEFNRFLKDVLGKLYWT